MVKNYILLEDMRFYAYHGVMEEERKTGNHFRADLQLQLDLSEAALSDRLEDTVNYADIYSIVKVEMEIPSNLLEHVAGRIVKQIRLKFSKIKHVKIKLSKLNPPVGGEVASASVILQYTSES